MDDLTHTLTEIINLPDCKPAKRRFIESVLAQMARCNGYVSDNQMYILQPMIDKHRKRQLVELFGDPDLIPQ